MSGLSPEQIAEEIRATARGIMDFASGDRNSGPFSEEIFRTNVQINAALTLLAERLEKPGVDQAGPTSP